ncbi:hypothetical protein BV25DRAFT_1797687 [Artomyces pyxidatus]|uniref:Uncharacterized protein n=1 Tax=Artomyces pyxidatus TaxID=48021 RepID=A0ACB8TBQ8_9AGAM|nr:hypothetical protein BV25DRAFT_1797687 [Artomyces pyxidatus]
MSVQAASIHHLPEPVRTKLRSAQILTSLPQVVSELVQNSLDAGARQIEIGIDCETWECWVKDDGTGVSRDGMSELSKGFESGRYNTSKTYAPLSLDNTSAFGFRGEALASAADVSCLEISSRTKRSRESWSVIVKGGKCLYHGPSTRWRRENPGTVVCMRDIFYNLPIRRRSHPSASRTAELIRKDIEAFAYVFPGVSFTLDDLHRASGGLFDKGRIVTIPRTSSTLSTFRHLNGRALVERVEEIDATSGDMKLQGFVSLEGALSKAWFIYPFTYHVNHHPLEPCHLQHVIERKFAHSSFAKHAFDEGGETSHPRTSARRSPRKAERKPIYVLDLLIPPQNVDNCLEPAKTTMQFLNDDAVHAFVESVVEDFLVRHGFLIRASIGEHCSPSPRKKRRLDSPIKRCESFPGISSWDDDGFVNHPQPEEIIWTDPSTGVTFVVDPRTGNSYPSHTSRSKEEALDGRESRHPPVSRRTLDTRFLHQNGTSSRFTDEDTMPEWIFNALQGNPAYASREPQIKPVSLSQSHFPFEPGPSQRPSQSHRRLFDACSSATQDQPLTGRFHRSDLLRAKVVNQLDRKFIVCTIDSPGDCDQDADTPGSCVILVVDQHAASERVRVERFQRDLCIGFLDPDQSKGVARTPVSPPKPVLLTRREADVLWTREDIRGMLDRWGFEVVQVKESRECGSDDAYEQIMVGSVPQVVGEKLLMRDELKDLLKGFLAAIDADDISAIPPSNTQLHDGSDSEDPFMWQKALRWCPKELLELLNSRACRGAIMFNDTLTVEQCERLLQQLAETAFPFQCAHGRSV